MRDKDQSPTQQWRLPFHQDQTWTALPESNGGRLVSTGGKISNV